MISVAIQGGAMRSIYCLGAIRALVDRGLAPDVKSIHATSAGCVAGAVLAKKIAEPSGPTVAEMGDKLLGKLSGDRFINLWRPRRMVDVAYLVDTIKAVTGLSTTTLRAHRLIFEVALTDARSGTASYVDLASVPADRDLYQGMLGTMAVPLLYPPKVVIGGRHYMDGGITDPLPVLRALRQSPRLLIAISSVAKSNLGRELEGNESRIVRFLPILPSVIRHLLLSRNPLGVAVEDLIEADLVGGIQVVRIAPRDQRELGHRLETDRSRLAALEKMGYADASRALTAIAPQAEVAGETKPTDRGIPSSTEERLGPISNGLGSNRVRLR
ncbi:patatin-like phospholipase family protein [Micromonospora sp. DT229]|uniref:patatin-like phospholipase family protein n=1 Tax=Micromonospora sp. DT229 TaxID=3393430 RepID=UPI003CE6BD7C